MKLLFLTFILAVVQPINWLGNFNTAQTEAKTNHKLILINFSGSDWCGPCIRLKKEILESDIFSEYANNHLLLVRADFPRQKKNQLSAEQVKLNEALAEKYNPDGKFPYTLLVNEEGKVLKSWDGYISAGADQFVKEIAAFEPTK